MTRWRRGSLWWSLRLPGVDADADDLGEGTEDGAHEVLQPFDWRYTRADLNTFLTRLAAA